MPTVRAFISYAHEPKINGHAERALALTQSLRLRGIEAHIDRFVEHDPPVWPRWMHDEVKEADFVLCLVSPSYKERAEGRGDPHIGRGARWEGAIITEDLYDGTSHRRKYLTVILEKCSPEDIPDILMPTGVTYYLWPKDDELLYRRLTGQPAVVPAPLGGIVMMPPFPSLSTQLVATQFALQTSKSIRSEESGASERALLRSQPELAARIVGLIQKPLIAALKQLRTTDAAFYHRLDAQVTEIAVELDSFLEPREVRVTLLTDGAADQDIEEWWRTRWSGVDEEFKSAGVSLHAFVIKKTAEVSVAEYRQMITLPLARIIPEQ
jgi:hypothetical protein